MHTRATDELDATPHDITDRMREAIVDVAATEQPSSHRRVTQLQGGDYLGIRVGDYRAVVKLDKPDLQILRIGHRGQIYRSESDLGSRA